MRALFVCLMLGVSAVAQAAVYTLDPNDFVAGFDVMRRVPGVTLLEETVPMGPDYRPRVKPLTVKNCLATELCPDPGGTRKFGGAFDEGVAANDCYLAVPLGCMYARTTVLRAIFSTPPHSVSFLASWLSDDPVLFAYDEFGNLIGECNTHLVPGLPDDCVRTTTGDFRVGFRTVIKLRKPGIASLIVAGSFSAVRLGQMKFVIF